MLDQAIAIAATAFEGKFDKGGFPYILHCLHVMHKVGPHDQELMTIAVLHDLIEDTRWRFQDLRDVGFSDRVIDALICLTHKEDEPYEDYIERISMNKDAVKVKIEDLIHNSSTTRMKGLRKKDFKRLEKYLRAYEYLKDL